MTDATPVKLTCPVCGSTDIANINGKGTDIVSCRGCGKDFGTAEKVKAAVMADVRKQATSAAKKSLRSVIRKINRR